MLAGTLLLEKHSKNGPKTPKNVQSRRRPNTFFSFFFYTETK